MVAFIGHFTSADIAQQLHACIGCQECLLACPTIDQPVTIGHLNSQTLSGPITLPIARFARACTQCGACASVCPVGLHREAMMLWLKIRLLQVTQECAPAPREEAVVEHPKQRQFIMPFSF